MCGARQHCQIGNRLSSVTFVVGVMASKQILIIAGVDDSHQLDKEGIKLNAIVPTVRPYKGDRRSSAGEYSPNCRRKWPYLAPEAIQDPAYLGRSASGFPSLGQYGSGGLAYDCWLFLSVPSGRTDCPQQNSGSQQSARVRAAGGQLGHSQSPRARARPRRPSLTRLTDERIGTAPTCVPSYSPLAVCSRCQS